MKYSELKAKIEAAKSQEEIERLLGILRNIKNNPFPDIEALKDEYEPSRHKVMQEEHRPKKQIFKPASETTPGIVLAPGQTAPKPTLDKQVEVTRTAIPIQKMIVESRVNFGFGLPVEMHSSPKEGKEQELQDVINKILDANKIYSINKEYAREAHRATIVAEYWAIQKTEKPHKKYGRPEKFKFRCMLWKPWDGNKLYPLYDEYNDLICFSREYSIFDDDNVEVVHFEAYTEDFKYEWTSGGKDKQLDWVVIPPVVNQLGKIPVTFTKLPQAAYDDVVTCIHRLETAISDLGDTNLYHAAPKLVMIGEVKGMFQKGDTGGVIKAGKDAKVEYLTWKDTAESLKLELELLIRFIHSLTNTPDLSFEQMAKMTNPSGETLKMMLVAPLLQVLQDSEKFNDWLERRTNILLGFIADLMPDLKEATETLNIEAKIIPFNIEDMTTKIANLMAANGNRPILSQKTSMIKSGLVEDVVEELAQITAEQDAADKRENENMMKQNAATFNDN